MKRILCLETEWGINNSNRLSDNASVRTMLRFIELLSPKKVGVSYRTVATVEELRYYLSQMSKSMNEEFEIIYLAFHGTKGKILLHEAKDKNTVDDYVSLEEIAEICDGERLKGKHVIFGSCETMSAAESRILAFKQKTGAESVTGYTKEIEFISSSLLDAALINEILTRKPKKNTIEQNMRRYYDGMINKLGMVFY